MNEDISALCHSLNFRVVGGVPGNDNDLILGCESVAEGVRPSTVFYIERFDFDSVVGVNNPFLNVVRVDFPAFLGGWL